MNSIMINYINHIKCQSRSDNGLKPNKNIGNDIGNNIGEVKQSSSSYNTEIIIKLKAAHLAISNQPTPVNLQISPCSQHAKSPVQPRCKKAFPLVNY